MHNPFAKKTKNEEVTEPNAKEMAHEARKGNAQLYSRLCKIEFTDKTGTIPEETMRSYELIIERMKKALDDAPAIVSDTKLMDDYLGEIASCVGDAIAGGHAETVKELLGYLNSGISEIRNRIDSFSELKQAQSVSKLERLADISRGIITCCQIEDEIKEKEQQIAGKRKEYECAFEDYNKSVEHYLEENPNGEEELRNAAGQKGDLSGEILSLGAKKKRIVALFNKVKELGQLKGYNEVMLQSRREALETLKTELETTDNLLDQAYMERIRKYHADFADALNEIKNNNQKLNDITAEFDSMIDVFFSDEYFKNLIAATDVEFEKIVKAREQKEAGRRIAQQQEQEQGQVQENRIEPTKQVNS